MARKRLLTSEEKRQRQHEYYLKLKAEAEALGVPISHYIRSPEQRAKYYQTQKARGNPQKQYRAKIEEDPLFNRKEHIKRKSRNIQWQTVKGNKENFAHWFDIVESIRKSDLSSQELAQELADTWWTARRYHKEKNEELKTIYRPRITNTVLTGQQIRELDNLALSHGLTSQHELIQTTVSYYGTLKDINSREEDKEVDIYTVQKIGEDYSEDIKKHTVKALNGRDNHGRLVAQRIKEQE